MVRIGRRRHEARLADLETFRLVRRAADEDVTVFGEELSLLHEETLATPLDDAMRADYEQALDAYERANCDSPGRAPSPTSPR